MFLMLAGAALAMSPQQGGDSVLGRWKTETRNGVVEITRCGASICGRLLTSDGIRTNPNLNDANNRDAKLRNRRLQGLTILWGFKQDGVGWSGGSIYNADDGRTYGAKVTPSGGGQLKVRGCVFVPLCKTQTWTRLR